MLAATSDSLPAIYGNIQAGQLKALAVVDDQRSAYLPDVPTLAEAGFQNLSTVAFFGLVAPRARPRKSWTRSTRNCCRPCARPSSWKKCGRRR